jgi:hypothetical protein
MVHTGLADPRWLFYFSNARRFSGQANYIFVAAVREEAAVDLLRAADGFFGSRALSRRAMGIALECDTHFEFTVRLLVGHVNECSDEYQPRRQDNPPSLALLRHTAKSKITTDGHRSNRK